jgi:predicted transcriptional regulator YheO
MTLERLKLLEQMADGIAAQFGNGCEVAVHDLTAANLEHSIIYIVNGHVTGRKAGDGPSHVVLELLRGNAPPERDHLAYLTRTPDGKILKSSSLFVRDAEGRTEAVFAINFDISALTIVENALKEIVSPLEQTEQEPEKIPQNVSDLLDELIRQSVALVGKPVALMTKEDKTKAIQFLNRSGAFLITKSGDKVARHFDISKYTLYSYLDAK